MSNTYTLAYSPTMKEPEKTTVAIKRDVPYSYFERTFDGDYTQKSESDLIEMVLDALRTELDPASALVKVQGQLTQTTAALEESTRLIKSMQVIILETSDNFVDVWDRLDTLEAQVGIKHEEETDETKETEHGDEHANEDNGGLRDDEN